MDMGIPFPNCLDDFSLFCMLVLLQNFVQPHPCLWDIDGLVPEIHGASDPIFTCQRMEGGLQFQVFGR